MSKFKNFIKYKRDFLIFTLAITFINYLVNYAFDLKKEVLIYNTVLIFSAFIIIMAISYIKYKNLLEIIREKLYRDSINDLNYDEISNIFVSHIKDLNRYIKNRESEEIKKINQDNNFYTLWTHEIKTPISAMEMLLNSNDVDIYSLKKELTKIDSYVNKSLAYSRSGSKSTDFLFKKVEVDLVIKEIIRKYSQFFITKRIKLNFNNTEIKTITDEKWLKFILEQIIYNSIKYTKEGTISINKLSENSFEIVDTGVGIKGEDLPRIFEMGYTGYNGRIYSKSTGVGLYIVKKISKELNIDIIVDSEFRKGTKVLITFMNNSNLTNL